MQTQTSPVDDHEAAYRIRQLRIGTWIAAVVTALATVRILVRWPAGLHWLAVPLLVILALHVVPARLPWGKIVSRPGIERRLAVWWTIELTLMFGFSALDPAPLQLYPCGVMVVMVAVVPLYPPRMLAVMGAVATTLIVPLAALVGTSEAALVGPMALLTAIVVGLCVLTAANIRRLNLARKTAERRTEALLENASDAVIAVAKGNLVYASSSARRVLGYDPAWLTPDRMSDITHPDAIARVREWFQSLYASAPGTVARTDSRARRADGVWRDLELVGTNLMADPDVNALVVAMRDVTEQKQLEEELTRQAFEDSLTSLPNRALFRDRMEHALARNRRGGGRVTLLLVDLDDFKMVNDTLGHNAGDQLIGTVSVRMQQQVRPSDTLARLGGDEFAVIVEDLDEVEAALLAERLLAAVRRPIRLGNRDYICTASIGVASTKAGGTGDADGPDTGELLRDADLAMYAAKGAGRDRFAVFDPAMHADILREAEERTEIERALVSHEFVVYYQPIVDLPSSRLIGVEALVRWVHPTRGLLGPAEFIPLAETTGLIVPLGRWVLQQACEQVAAWNRDLSEDERIRVSVNLSARQFQNAGLVEDVAAVIARTGIGAAQVVLEITESLLMQDTEQTVSTLHALRSLGIRLAIDDFGTGYSSLSYLKRFPVDILKIDRSFVNGIATDPEDATLAEAVVQLGRALRLQTVAEGIETHDQHSALRLLGCEYGQGFLFAKPVEANQIEQLLHPSGGPYGA